MECDRMGTGRNGGPKRYTDRVFGLIGRLIGVAKKVVGMKKQEEPYPYLEFDFDGSSRVTDLVLYFSTIGLENPQLLNEVKHLLAQIDKDDPERDLMNQLSEELDEFLNMCEDFDNEE